MFLVDKGDRMTAEKTMPNISSSSQRNNVSKIRSTETAFFELVEGLALYAFCITVPALFGIAIKYYENIHQHHGLYSSWITECYDTILDALYSSLCLDQKTPSSDFMHSVHSASCRFLVWITHHSGTTSNTSTSVKEKRFLTDLHIVGIVSLCLAIIRIVTFYCLIPEYLAPRQFNAIMRCKSSHVLSSASLSNFVSPKKKPAKPRIMKTNKINCISEDRKGAIL